MVMDRSGLGGGRDFPGHLRGSAAGHARHPGQDGRPGLPRRGGLECLERPTLTDSEDLVYLFDLTGKVALVTRGGRGVGAITWRRPRCGRPSRRTTPPAT